MEGLSAKRVLVTGGFGFVGGRIAAHLARAGHHLLLGSRRQVDTPSWLPGSETVQIQWNNVTSLDQACGGVDVVIHAAGMNARACALRPSEALEVNGVATARLVEAAGRAGVQRFIYLSTAHVYASSLEGSISEATCPRNLHPYATSHLSGEHAVLHASECGVLQGLVLRLSNSFGPPMHRDVDCWALFVNDLCRQVVETRKLVLQTSGLQQRNFIPLMTFCHIVEQLVFAHGDRMPGGIINAGSGTSQTVLEMAQFIQQRCAVVLGFEPPLERREASPEERYMLFDYRIDRLVSSGIWMNIAEFTNEIDNMLAYCQSIFT